MNTLTPTPETPKHLNQMIDAMLRHSIGLDPWFFERNAGAANFPPHDIVQIGEDQFRLTLAVAGFREDELEIVVDNDLLTISGTKKQIDPERDNYRLLYRGIASRDFSRQFKIGEHVYVEGALLSDGLLEVDLVRKLPESMKPKKISISKLSAVSTVR
jgi:molecular chaperone IbpA